LYQSGTQRIGDDIARRCSQAFFLAQGMIVKALLPDATAGVSSLVDGDGAAGFEL
jgi:hypothetical protein